MDRRYKMLLLYPLIPVGIETSAEPGDEIPVGLNVSDILVRLEDILSKAALSENFPVLISSSTRTCFR
jgi:hypothetical protein